MRIFLFSRLLISTALDADSRILVRQEVAQAQWLHAQFDETERCIRHVSLYGFAPPPHFVAMLVCFSLLQHSSRI
jgi:hypothetical protein